MLKLLRRSALAIGAVNLFAAAGRSDIGIESGADLFRSVAFSLILFGCYAICKILEGRKYEAR